MAKLSIKYHPAARLEALDAFEWYRDRSLGAAERFQSELELAQAAIAEAPETWAEYRDGTRRYLLKRYPYLIVYRLSERGIEIIAIAHGRREPEYWLERLKSAQ
jgi:plasmid stabilization system protein ParE